jgi:Asp-tRNA(Asn)/Glu-tRNA(Gln) amidotransferase A subunit family amidase
MLPAAFCSVVALPTSTGVSFVTLGDWGGAALEEPSKPYAQNVVDVAAALKVVMAAKDAQFVVNTGDNFYWCGIKNTTDFQVAKDWVDSYEASVRAVPWYSVLGNHEYGHVSQI